MIELLDETQPWLVEMPAELCYQGRPLEARNCDGEPRYTWNHSPLNGRWYGKRTGGATLASFVWDDLLALCLGQNWTLHSLPGGDTGDKP